MKSYVLNDFWKMKIGEKIENQRKTSWDELVKKLCTKFQTCMAIGSLLKVCTNGKGASIERKRMPHFRPNMPIKFENFWSRQNFSNFSTASALLRDLNKTKIVAAHGLSNLRKGWKNLNSSLFSWSHKYSTTHVKVFPKLGAATTGVVAQ